ncbi:ribosome biogenesis GTP-binding protein YihA/YsxC [Echinimonas agarilytica]|uniref:Probable GTP-binding protein EngB n=2 Tax=Echinimonas agarilytica TaxID=1215918 RepID=A0AA41W3T2_9GAMM|nr:ribosome biogenesis GTP-binding protein YihA/YsxC [Echinimonas agarilytica]
MPEDEGIEIAFAGRSNAGKSSALNALTRQKRLAKTSSTPGRTQLINVFNVTDDVRLIDLPGYGYAKVPIAVRNKWQKALGEYLQARACLKGLVVLMDIRHPLKDLDQQMLGWAAESGLQILVALTKADKLSQSERSKTLRKVREACLYFGENVEVIAFSSTRGFGLPEMESVITRWCTEPNPIDSEELDSDTSDEQA